MNTWQRLGEIDPDSVEALRASADAAEASLIRDERLGLDSPEDSPVGETPLGYELVDIGNGLAMRRYEASGRTFEEHGEPAETCHASPRHPHEGIPDHFEILAHYAHFGDDESTPSHVRGETGGLTRKWDAYRREQREWWELSDGPPRRW